MKAVGKHHSTGKKQQYQDSVAVTRAADDFFSAVSAARHHEKRSRHKGQSVNFATRFFREEIACAGYWRGKRQRTQFLLFVLLKRTHFLDAVKRVRISKNTRVVSACKKNLHPTNYFSRLQDSVYAF